jgi:FkbM family methyltransferase
LAYALLCLCTDCYHLIETVNQMANLRPIPFVIVASNHGTMIINRNDYRMVDANSGYGLGFQILNTSSFDQSEVDFALGMLSLRRQYFGDGVVALDCGANVGVHTIEWAKYMHKWGSVIAIEAQERIYYALAGNVAINNCLNATAVWGAVGRENAEIKIPVPNYLAPSSFGSLELKHSATNEYIGQAIDYSEENMASIQQRAIDSFGLQRLDFIKIDVEGMELDVLAGASNVIQTFQPIMMIEIIKSDRAKIEAVLKSQGYEVFPLGINILAVHGADPSLQQVRQADKA